MDPIEAKMRGMAARLAGRRGQARQNMGRPDMVGLARAAAMSGREMPTPGVPPQPALRAAPTPGAPPTPPAANPRMGGYPAASAMSAMPTRPALPVAAVPQAAAPTAPPPPRAPGMAKGGKVGRPKKLKPMKLAKGGKVKCTRGDGCAMRGKTKGKMR